MTITVSEYCRLIEIAVTLEGSTSLAARFGGKKIHALVSEIAQRNDREINDALKAYREKELKGEEE